MYFFVLVLILLFLNVTDNIYINHNVSLLFYFKYALF